MQRVNKFLVILVLFAPLFASASQQFEVESQLARGTFLIDRLRRGYLESTDISSGLAEDIIDSVLDAEADILNRNVALTSEQEDLVVSHLMDIFRGYFRIYQQNVVDAIDGEGSDSRRDLLSGEFRSLVAVTHRLIDFIEQRDARASIANYHEVISTLASLLERNLPPEDQRLLRSTLQSTGYVTNPLENHRSVSPATSSILSGIMGIIGRSRDSAFGEYLLRAAVIPVEGSLLGSAVILMSKGKKSSKEKQD